MVTLKGEVGMIPSLKNKGFTLIEVILVLGFMGIIIATTTSLILFSNRTHEVIVQEFQVQSDMRVASEVINQQVRHATAVFLLNSNQYNSQNLSDGWNYFGVSDDESEIIHYHWNKGLNKHDIQVLASASPGVSYNMSFSPTHEDTLMVDFILNGFTESSNNPKTSIKSSLNALNTVVVDDSGTATQPSVVLAYRSQDIPTPDQIKVAVAMVLDTSGSMDWDMNGNTTNNNNIKRIQLMKNRSKELLDTFSSIGNVYVSIIPFSKSANKPGDFYLASEKADDLKGEIDGLNAVGGTNIGDGLRRAYHQHDTFNKKNTSSQILNYTILLMDGNPTYWPRRNGESYFGDGDITESHNGGNGSITVANIAASMPYIENLGNNVIRKNDTTQGVFQKTFVIGFSALSSDVSNAKTIAEEYLNHPTDSRINGTYYPATSSEELAEVFRSISEVILKETWHIYGPAN